LKEESPTQTLKERVCWHDVQEIKLELELELELEQLYGMEYEEGLIIW
jgi:hypothetical protein